MGSAAQVAPRLRLAIALLCGLVAGSYAQFGAGHWAKPRDFGQVLYAAHAVLSGHDPYQLIGPHLAYDWGCPLLYPLPAVVATTPLTFVSGPLAHGLFFTLAAGTFAWALMEDGYSPLLGFGSASMLFAAEVVQWSPLLAAGLVVAPLSALWIAKPTIGAALFASRPDRWRWAIGGGLALAAIAFLVQPGWLAHWLHAARRPCDPVTPYTAPVLVPGGVLALLCLLRWRRPEARLVAALACVPQTLLLYETIPLFLVPRTIRESGLLTALSWLGLSWLLHQHPTSAAHRLTLSGQMIVLCFYLPCTAMVLTRPNEAPARSGSADSAWRRWRSRAYRATTSTA